jgi:hypothetical protein
MRKATRFISGLMLCMLLNVGLAPTLISADGGSDQEWPIRLYGTATGAPIGSITGDPVGARAVAINGRVTRGDQLLWGGELLQALSNESVRVAFDDVGSLTLESGAMVRVATSRAVAGEGSRRILVASLIRGDISVKLNDQAGAYVEASGTAFTASSGAKFQIVIRDNRAAVNTAVGEVKEVRLVRQTDLKIRALDDLGRPIASGSRFSVRARSTRQIQIQVTDTNDRPVANVAVVFALGDPCLGTLGVGGGTNRRETTDNRGVAAVPFTAGAAKCAAALTATIEGTNIAVTLQAQVTSGGFFTARNSFIAASVIGGVGAGVGIYYATRKQEEITPVPPPVVRP